MKLSEFFQLYHQISKTTTAYPRWRLCHLEMGHGESDGYYILNRYTYEFNTGKFQVYSLELFDYLHPFHIPIIQRMLPLKMTIYIGHTNFDPFIFLQREESSITDFTIYENGHKLDLTKLSTLKNLKHLTRISMFFQQLPDICNLFTYLPLDLKDFRLNYNEIFDARQDIISGRWDHLTSFLCLEVLDLLIDQRGIFSLCEGYFPSLTKLRLRAYSYSPANLSIEHAIRFPNLSEFTMEGQLSFLVIIGSTGGTLRYLNLIPYTVDESISQFDYTSLICDYAHFLPGIQQMMIPGNKRFLEKIFPNTIIITDPVTLEEKNGDWIYETIKLKETK